MQKRKGGSSKGIGAALLSALFLGLSPIFGKQAIELGFSPLAVVAIRTCLAAGLLLIIVAIFKRSYLYIYPAGLAGCFLAGSINGLGSIFYYLSLGSLPASIGQLLYSTYPIFLALFLILDRQPPSRLTLIRIFLALGGIVFLTYPKPIDLHGGSVFLMLAAAALYAIHLPINQRVLYDIPSPTVTMYTLISMSAVVLPAFLIFGNRPFPQNPVWWPVAGLTLVTFFSRLTLFMGVKHLGGMQTALLGLGELLVTLFVSYIWLHERLETMQWVGAGLLGASLILVGFERISSEKKRSASRLFRWLRPPEIPPNIPWGPHE